MFSELFESVARPTTKRKRWAVAISATLQSACLSILLIVPLIYTEALPKTTFKTTWVGPPGPILRTAAEVPVERVGARAVPVLVFGVMRAPARIPPRVDMSEEPPSLNESGVGQGQMGDSTVFDLPGVAPNSAEAVIPPVVTSVPQRVPVTSTIETAKLISRVQPAYPALAIQARIQGNVVLHAIIGRDGEVSELQVLSGDPLVVNAAVEAVRQWRYSPTLLNGQAVEVETTITVSFVLGQ
jgi:periplasmic protein TonB